MPARFESLGVGDAYRRAYTAANYRLRTFSGGRWADRCRPTDIGFLMTNLCNAKCVHCDIWKNKGKDDTPTIDQYKATLSEMRAWLGPVHVFFSGGEALLRPYTPEVLGHAASVGLFAEMLTHGYWDDQSRIEKAALANPGRITVSLDGIGEAHTIIRGREKFFEKTTRTLETLKRLRAEQSLGYVDSAQDRHHAAESPRRVQRGALRCAERHGSLLPGRRAELQYAGRLPLVRSTAKTGPQTRRWPSRRCAA